MLLLTIVLQVLTLKEFISCRELFKKDETISGLSIFQTGSQISER